MKNKNAFTTNVKTIMFSREAKFEKFLRALWHGKIISLVLSKAEHYVESNRDIT